MNYLYFMEKAYKEAVKAFECGEVPIGAVVVYENKVISTGYNKRVTDKNTLSHAEILAIYDACEYLGDWRLEDCTLFVTIEPCAMCSGAVIQARMKEVVYGAKNYKGGCCESIVNLFDYNFNHKVNIVGGVMEEKCSLLMKEYFKNIRNNEQ